MKISQLKALLREEVQKVLKELNETAQLSDLVVGDMFKLQQDAIISATMGSGSYYKISHTKYGDITFVLVQVNRTTIDCITMPLDNMKKLPQSAMTSVQPRQVATPQGNITVNEVIRFHVGKANAKVTKQ
jgi:hypothetical protein